MSRVTGRLRGAHRPYLGTKRYLLTRLFARRLPRVPQCRREGGTLRSSPVSDLLLRRLSGRTCVWCSFRKRAHEVSVPRACREEFLRRWPFSKPFVPNTADGGPLNVV